MARIWPPEHWEKVKETPVEMEGAEKCTIRWLLHKGKGAKNFAMRIFTLEEGGHTPYHKHDYEHEIFCLEGEGVVVMEGEEYSLLPGYYGIVPADVTHNFVNKGKQPMRFMCLIPGEVKG
ncbi:MAG: cupin domain-containing protein [Candidatus Thermoplasmatota archaeon]|nr:cupin domain-containing protein [Candidatus Thermoplasmatota archaeon]